MPLMSIRAYARHRGVTQYAVQKAIRDGRITKRKDGKISSKVADRQWERNTDTSKPLNSITGTPKHRRKPGEPMLPMGSEEAESAPAAAARNGKAPNYAQARAQRETFLAKRAELDYRVAAGKLVAADQIEKGAFAAARVARDALMTLPDRLGPIVAAVDDADACRAVIAAEVRKVCERMEEALDRAQGRSS